jgi:hypothetical protein
MPVTIEINQLANNLSVPKMTKTEMSEILANHLAKYHQWSYEQLAEKIPTGSWLEPTDCLEHIEGTSEDGTEYQIEFNVMWNDKPNEELRVDGSLYTEPQKPLLGIIPLYSPEVTDCLIMSKDGRFL